MTVSSGEGFRSQSTGIRQWVREQPVHMQPGPGCPPRTHKPGASVLSELGLLPFKIRTLIRADCFRALEMVPEPRARLLATVLVWPPLMDLVESR